jgi:hypothetical protein
MKLKEVIKQEPVPGRHYALVEGCHVLGQLVDQCFIVAGVPTDIDGVKDWDPNLYSLSQGSWGSIRTANDTKNSAIKNGRWKSEYDLSVYSGKWKPTSSNGMVEILEILYPRPKYNMTFLGYVRPDVDIGKLGKLTVGTQT